MSSRESEHERAVARALRQSETFHGFVPRSVVDVNLDWPKSLTLIGHCAQVDYISDKYDGVVRRYWHEFDLSNRRPCLIFSDPQRQKDGSQLLIIKGHFVLHEDGIIG